jgi:hypothetical protein
MAFWTVPNTFGSLSGNQPASYLDDNFQALSIAPQYASLVSGSDNIVITVPLASTTGNYQAGMTFIFTAVANNTTSVTLSVQPPGGGLPYPATSVTKNNNEALVANDILANAAYQVYYDGVNFHLLNPALETAATQNKIINSGMVIDQRFESTGNTNPATGEYTLDRWYVQYNGVANPFGQQQSADVPSNAYAKSLLSTVVTRDNAIAAGAFYAVGQKIEGYDIVDLIGVTFTLGFWVKSSVTGTYCVAFRNSAANYSYVATYSISVANTWEYKTITLTNGLTSLATWLKTNGIGLFVTWALAVGSTYQTTAGTWAAGNYLATSAQTNWMATAANQFRITGVQLSLGSILPQWESRPFEEELALCQRYYQKSFNIGVVPAQNAGTAGAKGLVQSVGASVSMNGNHIQFPTTMRATPTAWTFYNTSAANAFAYNASVAASWTLTTIVASGMSGGLVSGTTAPGSAAGQTNYVHWTAEAEL